MKPYRLLIPLTVQFSVRYVVRSGLLDKIKEFATPVILLGWEDAALKTELEAQGVEVHTSPQKQIGRQYYRVRNKLSTWHFERINSPSTAIDRRRTMRMTPWKLRLKLEARRTLIRAELGLPGRVERLLAEEKRLIHSDTNLADYAALIEKIRPDAIFCLTPYFLDEEMLLRAAAERGIKMVTSILSFDNITTRGWMAVDFEEYYVWNRYNRDELLRIYPKIRPEDIRIVGAPQFDFYYDRKNIWEEHYWRSQLGIPVDRPVILFGSASAIIAPQEEQWLSHIDEAIENKEIPLHPIILMRRHPNEATSRWNRLINGSKNIYFDEPWQPGEKIPGKTNISCNDIKKLASTLYHSAVHVNASSTMTVDGAIFDRPQIGPAYDETGKYHQEAMDIYLREHYLPITHSGGLVLARSREQLITAINDAFTNPEEHAQGRKKIIQEICTYNDGLSTSRISQALRGYIEEN